MFGVKGVMVLAVGEVGGELHLLVETPEQIEGADPVASSPSRTGDGSTCCAAPRGYANALRDGLGDAVAVLDAFRVVKLGTQVMNEVGRRVQQDTLHRRAHRDHPLHKIRGLLRHGREKLSERQVARLDAALNAGDPTANAPTAQVRRCSISDTLA